MSIRQKTFLIIFSTVLLLMAALFATSRRIVQNRFVSLEREQAGREGEQALAVLDTQLDSLSLLAADWAEWDAVYDFINGQNAEWVAQEVDPQGMANLDIDILAVFDLNGRLWYGANFEDGGA